MFRHVRAACKCANRKILNSFIYMILTACRIIINRTLQLKYLIKYKLFNEYQRAFLVEEREYVFARAPARMSDRRRDNVDFTLQRLVWYVDKGPNCRKSSLITIYNFKGPPLGAIGLIEQWRYTRFMQFCGSRELPQILASPCHAEFAFNCGELIGGPLAGTYVT